LAQPSVAYLGAFPDFSSPDGALLEDYVRSSLISDFEVLAGRKITWAYSPSTGFEVSRSRATRS